MLVNNCICAQVAYSTKHLCTASRDNQYVCMRGGGYLQCLFDNIDVLKNRTSKNSKHYKFLQRIPTIYYIYIYIYIYMGNYIYIYICYSMHDAGTHACRHTHKTHNKMLNVFIYIHIYKLYIYIYLLKCQNVLLKSVHK